MLLVHGELTFPDEDGVPDGLLYPVEGLVAGELTVPDEDGVPDGLL